MWMCVCGYVYVYCDAGVMIEFCRVIGGGGGTFIMCMSHRCVY